MDESSEQTTETVAGGFSERYQVLNAAAAERLLTGDASELRESKNSTYLDRVEALETELAQSQASFTQLDLELKAKTDDLINLQKRYGEFEVEMSAKLSDMETKWTLTMNNVRTVEMESKVASLEQELTVAKDAAALYKVSSEESNESLADAKEKLARCQADLESLRKTCLGNDGLSMTTLYVKYQEASDAFRHEQLERKQLQAVLDRVLREMEQKAGFILEERAKHERILDSYSEMDKKLQNSVSDKAELQMLIQELKAEMRRKDRENDMAQKEVFDLQNQVTILLKECQDINLYKKTDASAENSMLSFKDIGGIVEQNVELKRRVDSLSADLVSQEKSWKEKYDRDLEKSAENAVANFSLVVAREKEQKQMIESLHTSVATYKKLYEEELAKPQSSATSLPEEPLTKKRKLDNNVVDNARETFQNAHEKALERVKRLEEELMKSVDEIASLKSEAEMLAREARSSQEKLERFTREFEHLRDLYDGSKSRNDQYSQMIIDYQEKMRKNSDLMNSALDSSHRLSMEVSCLKQEKEISVSSEKRVYEEVHGLSERVSRLQASLDTIQSTENVREEARSAERRKHEKELNEKVQKITLEHENAMNIALQKAEELEKEVRRVLSDLAAAEVRASAAEETVKCLQAEVSGNNETLAAAKVRASAAEETVKCLQAEVSGNNETLAAAKVRASAAEEKVKCLQAEVSGNNESLVKEEALKQLEAAYEKSKAEAEAEKKSLEADVVSLRQTIEDLQGKLKSHAEADADADAEKCLEADVVSLRQTIEDLQGKLKSKAEVEADAEKKSLEADVVSLRQTIEDLQGKLDTKSSEAGNEDNMSEITVLEAQIASFKDDLEKERDKLSAAEASHERRVISLQSDANQELNKVSLALAALRNENSELRAKWEAEKTDADRKYDEVLELNKEKDEMISKQNQLLSDANVVGDDNKALKEQVEEKDARIQILQKTVERLKENLTKQKDECKLEKERREKLEKTVRESDKSTVDDDGPKSVPSLENLCLKRPSFASSEETAEPPVKKSKQLAPEKDQTAQEKVVTLNQAAKEETGKLIDINVECETAANIVGKLSSKSGAVGVPSETNVSPTSTLPRRGRGRPPGRGRGRGRLSRG